MGIFDSIFSRKKDDKVIETPIGYIKNGMEFFKENSPFNFLSDSLLFYSNNIKEQIKYINTHKIRSIKINNSKGDFNNLDFLAEIKHIEGVAILQDNLDLDPVYNLKNLKRLNCATITTDFDLSKFPELRILGITYNKFVHNISSCKNLSWLWIDKFKQDNLSDLILLTNLTNLNLPQTSIIDLGGIEHLNKLTVVNIDLAKQLTSLHGLSKNNSSLEVFSVYNAPKLNDYHSLENLSNLKKLFFGKTGEIENLDFIRNMSKLEQISIGMKVTDGNMSNLTNIKNVGFIDYPHYNLKMKDFPTVS